MAHTFGFVDPKTVSTKLDRLLTVRGDPKTGVGAEAWTEALAEVEPELLLRSVIRVVRELLIQDWADQRKADLRPQRALEAAEKCLAEKSAEALAEAKAAAKACTEAKNETFGLLHRIPEAARATAWVASGREPVALFDALAITETELLARIALTGEYERGPEQRRNLVALLKRVILPPEPTAVAPEKNAADAPPVPYSPEGHFELGQRLTHKKFGEVSVTSVGETWIEVEVAGEKKRLAHKPKAS